MTSQTSTHVRLPLWKQLLGSIVGMVAALGMYAIYTFASPYVIQILPASLTMPRVRAVTYTEQDRQVNQDRIIEMAREIERKRGIRN